MNELNDDKDNKGWSLTEKKHYAIIGIPDISYQEAKELCSTRDVDVKVKRKDGKENIYRPKKYKFDLDNFSSTLRNKWRDEDKEADVVTTQGIDIK